MRDALETALPIVPSHHAGGPLRHHNPQSSRPPLIMHEDHESNGTHKYAVLTQAGHAVRETHSPDARHPICDGQHVLETPQANAVAMAGQTGRETHRAPACHLIETATAGADHHPSDAQLADVGTKMRYGAAGHYGYDAQYTCARQTQETTP